MAWLNFDEGNPERFVMIPAGRDVCLMCDRKSRKSEVVKLTDGFKVRLCPKCFKEYENITKLAINSFKRI